MNVTFLIKYIICAVLFGLATNIGNAGFIQNKGQLAPNIRYSAKAKDCTVYLTDSSIILSYHKLEIENKRAFGSNIEMVFIGSNRNSNMIEIRPSLSKTNYFSNSNNVVNVGEYDTLIIENLYNNINLRLYLSDGYFAYDFILQSFANPELINIQFNGQDEIDITKQTVKLSTPYLTAYNDRLMSFYSDSEIPIKSAFRNNDGIISIDLEKYDLKKQVTIDPVIFSTFLGGSGFDYARTMAIDSSENVVVAGYTSSYDFPTKIGSFDTSFTDYDIGFNDVFVSKFDSTGTNLLFSTYIGGIGDEQAESIAIDASGNIYITGYTFSLRDYPFTRNCIDSLDLGGYDMFFTKLSPNGDSLIYSTLFGSASDDYAQAIAIDKFTNVYFTGYTKSVNDFRRTPFAFDTSSNGAEDVFIVKLAHSTNTLVYSTFVGGSGADFGQTIAVDNAGNAIVAGITRSTNFPISPFAFDRTMNDSVINPNSSSDGFIFKINPTGTFMIFSSYLGGSGKDAVYDICTDKYGDIYATGLTESTNFPFTKGVYDSTYNNLNSGAIYGDIFISKIKSSGDSLLYSTFLGGRGTDKANCITLDTMGNIYLTGTTNSTNFPVSRRAFQKIYADTSARTDAFVAKFSPKLDKLLYSSYLGGKRSDVGNAIIPLKDYSFYVSGWTSSPDFPISDSAFSKIYSDSAKADVFLARIKPNLIDIFFDSDDNSDGNNKNICIGDSVWVGAYAEGGIGGINYQWFPLTNVSNPTEPFTYIKPTTSRNYILVASDEIGNLAIDTVRINVLPLPQPEIFGPTMVLVKSETSYFAPMNSTSIYLWQVSNGTITSAQGTYQIKVKWADSISIGTLKVIETNAGNCLDSSSIQVEIGKNFTPTIVYGGSTTPCQGDTVILDAGDDYHFILWSTNARTRTISISETGSYWVYAADSSGFGGTSDTLKITFIPSPNPIIYGQQTVKPNKIYSYISDKMTGSKYIWDVDGGSILNGQSTDSITVRWNDTIRGSIQLEELNAAGCRGISSKMMIDIGGNFKPNIRILGSANICDGDTLLLDAGYGYSSYVWSNNETTRFIKVATADSFYCYVQDKFGFAGWTDTVHIRILPKPPIPFVSTFGNQFLCESDSLPMQWYFNNQVIPNANKKNYVADVPGTYKVCVRAVNACESCSEKIYYLVSVADNLNETFDFIVFPNPAKDILYISIMNNSSLLKLSIINQIGEVILKDEISENIDYKTYNLAPFSTGLYYIQLDNGTERIFRKIIKQ